jgi:hypothetical protein
MANKTDVKALQATNPDQPAHYDEIVMSANEMYPTVLEACEAITAITGADASTMRQVAEQLCKITEYMLPYKKSDMDTAQSERITAEKNQKDNAAGSAEKTEKAIIKDDKATKIYTHLHLLHRASRENFRTCMGYEYRPKPKAGTNLSHEQRIAKYRK